MARYDRIAPLTTPQRENVFPGWSVLADLEGRERDAELGRRARLRFLALRPVLRILAHGFDQVPLESYERQIETVREELGHLPARDPERARLAQYLHSIRHRSPAALASATLEFGAAIQAGGHLRGAEEFFRAGLQIARLNGLQADVGAALARIASVRTMNGDLSAARIAFTEAAQIALGAGDQQGWARATEGLARMAAAEQGAAAAETLWRDVLDRGRGWENEAVVAIGARGLAELELGAGRTESALELAWLALSKPADADERHSVLRLLGSAFARLGMLDVSDRCHRLAMQRGATEAQRAAAATGRTVAAAEAGDAELFRERRAELLRAFTAVRPAPPVYAETQIALGRGCLLVGDTDFARDHLREAIANARRQGRRDLLDLAGELLSELEVGAGVVRVAASRGDGETARRIAAAVAAYDDLVTAGG